MKNLSNEIKFFLYAWFQNFRNKKALGGNFLMHVMGMFLSNVSFYIIWMSFIDAVGDIKGWGILETFGLLSVSMLSFGLANVAFGTILHWYEAVPDGRLDVFLTKPKSLYMRLINQEFRMAASGDLLQGLIGVSAFLYFADASFSQISVLGLMLIPATLIFVGFFMVSGCLIFVFPQAPQIIKPFGDLFLLPTLQPLSLIEGALRTVYLFFVPALVVAGLPLEVFLEMDWGKVALSYGIAFGWMILSFFVLRFSLRMYESSNVPN